MPAPRAGRRLLLSAAGPTMRPVLHELAVPAFERYARPWGYDVRAVDLPADGTAADSAAQQAKWAKLRLLREALAEHRVNPNTGVWVMRNDVRSFRFLETVEAAGPQPGPWADQGAVLAALGWRRGDERYHWAGPGAGTPALAGTSWLPPGRSRCTSWDSPRPPASG